MTQSDFIIWLKGFLDANPTGNNPWNVLKEKIKEIDEPEIIYPTSNSSCYNGFITKYNITFKQVPSTPTK